MSQQSESLVVVQPGQITFEAARSRYEVLKQVVEESLIEGEDYGTLPGVPEPYLKKTGAEKLMAKFSLRPDPELKHHHEDWEKGVFAYRYRVTLYHGKEPVGACEAVCTNQEDKFKFRWIDADAPETKPQEDAMKRAKTGRWRKNGDSWLWQEKEEASNPYDQINSVVKRSQKRAMVGAVQVAFAASGFFAKAGKAAKKTSDKSGSSGAGSETKKKDGPTQFWLAVDAAGIKRADAKQDADKAISGEITWEQAIANLPK